MIFGVTDHPGILVRRAGCLTHMDAVTRAAVSKGYEVWWLIWNAFVRRVVTSESTTKRHVVLSLTKYAKRRVIVWRVLAMSHSRSAQIEGLATEPSDRATSRQRAARQCACWRDSLETGRQDDSAILRRLAYFASDKTKR
jgi:hypothetical protein